MIHHNARGVGAWAEELPGKPSLQFAGNEVLSGFGPNQAGNNLFWKCPQHGNSQKGHFRNIKTLPKHNSQVPKPFADQWHSLWQHMWPPAPHIALGVPKTLWLQWSLDAEDYPWKPAQNHGSTSARAGPLAVLLLPSFLVLSGIEIKVEFKLPRFPYFWLYSRLEVVVQNHWLKFQAPKLWTVLDATAQTTAREKAALLWLTCLEVVQKSRELNLTRTHQMGKLPSEHLRPIRKCYFH